MATTTWTCNKDSRIADNGSNLGAGTSDYLPVGKYAGYQYRSLLGFAVSWAGMVSITNATLHIKTSSQFYVAFGSSPSVAVSRITGSWSEGSSSGLSTSNAVVYPGPATTATHRATFSPGTAQDTWKTVDITAMVNDVFGGTFQGVQLIGWNGSGESTSSSDVSEFYAREFGSNDAYITVTYTTNTAAQAPTLLLPADAATAQSLNPTISFDHVDSDGDAIGSWDLQVSTDSTFASVTHLNLASKTLGISGVHIVNAYDTLRSTYGTGTALSNNVTYYWRARTTSQFGVTTAGAWSVTRHFKTAQLPVVTLTEPTVDATKLAKLTYTAGAGWAAPRLNVGWTFSCPDGGTQSSYQVFIESATTSGGAYTTWHDTGTVSGTATSIVDATTVVNGNYYRVKVRATCSHGQVSTYTATVRAKAAWATALHRYDAGAAPVSWTVGSIATTLPSGSTSVVIEYGSNSTTTTPGTFYAAVSSLTLNRYFFYRAFLLGYGVSPVTFPSLDKLVLTYNTVVTIADHWTLSSANISVDTTARAPGTNSMKLVGAGAPIAASQIVNVEPNTDYILSAWVKTLGSPAVALGFSSGTPTGLIVGLAADTPSLADVGWTHVKTGVWNSGASTSVYILCRQDSAGPATVWFDDVKLEASHVATPFSVGGHQDAATVDGGGVQVDAFSGGIFRMRGSAGGTRDLIALGAHGLLLGTDVNLYSDSSHSALIDGALTVTGLGDQTVLVKFNMDRPWVFKQNSSGATNTLDLAPLNDTKSFRIMSQDNTQTMLQVTSNNSGPTLGGFSAPGQRAIYLPITEAGLDSATLITTGATPNLMRAINYADAATQGAYWTFVLPNDASAAGPFLVTISWTPAATDAVAHTVRWTAILKNVSSTVDVTAAGSSFAFTGASAARTINIGVAESGPDMTATVAPSAGARYRLLLQRIGADAADTYVGAVRVYSVGISYWATR